MSIDRRIHYIVVLDTETANTIERTIPAVLDEDGNVIKAERTDLDMSNVLAYDIGWAIVDKRGKVYRTRSFVNSDIYTHEKDLMSSAYYAKKLPQYEFDLSTGRRVLATLSHIRKTLHADMEEFGTKTVCAHNHRFDYNGLNATERYVTKSFCRYFYPFGTELWDTMKMAQDVIVPMPSFRAWCAEHNGMSRNGQPSKSAENLYRFITDNPLFHEQHTGLEDVMIEKEILAYCFRQHKAMRKDLFPLKDWPELTDFQRDLSRSLREVPVLRL